MDEVIDNSNDFNVYKCQDKACQYWDYIEGRCGEKYCKKYLNDEEYYVIV